MWTFISFVVAAVPGVTAWWTGRQLLARRDDPALPERILARATRLVQVMAATISVLFVVSPHKPWIFVLPLWVGTSAAFHRTRRCTRSAVGWPATCSHPGAR